MATIAGAILPSQSSLPLLQPAVSGRVFGLLSSTVAGSFIRCRLILGGRVMNPIIFAFQLATLWCTGAVGTPAALGPGWLAVVGADAVLATRLLLRPKAGEDQA